MKFKNYESKIFSMKAVVLDADSIQEAIAEGIFKLGHDGNAYFCGVRVVLGDFLGVHSQTGDYFLSRPEIFLDEFNCEEFDLEQLEP